MRLHWTWLSRKFLFFLITYRLRKRGQVRHTVAFVTLTPLSKGSPSTLTWAHAWLSTPLTAGLVWNKANSFTRYQKNRQMNIVMAPFSPFPDAYKLESERRVELEAETKHDNYLNACQKEAMQSYKMGWYGVCVCMFVHVYVCVLREKTKRIKIKHTKICIKRVNPWMNGQTNVRYIYIYIIQAIKKRAITHLHKNGWALKALY